ncbi:histidine kinase dimerization/phospho-acceptor domain-containing protein, partial [Anaeromicrobium sediminis]
MIKSVRTKLFLIFTMFLILSISLSFFMNVKYLEKYYVYRNERIFFSTYEQISEAYLNEAETIEDIMYNIDRNENINSLILFEKSPVIKYSSSFRKREAIKNGVIRKDLADLIFTKMNDLNTDYIYEVIKLHTPDFREIVFIKELDTGEILILKKPLHVVSTSSKIANEFLLFTGVITIIFGSIFIFLFSKRITRPIIDLSHIAKSISNLDFSKKYKVKSKDEIGILGDSMNLICEELNKAIDDLIEANVKLKEDIERRKEIDEMRKKFISSISHELKSPIGITKGYAEGLKYHIANNEEKRNRYCDILIHEADKMDKMIKQLLNLSNLESEVFKLEKSIFN